MVAVPNSNSNSEQELLITAEAVVDISYKDDVMFTEPSSGQYVTSTMFIPSTEPSSTDCFDKTTATNNVQQETTKFQHNDKAVQEFALLKSYEWIPILVGLVMLLVMFVVIVSVLVWVVKMLIMVLIWGSIAVLGSPSTGRAIIKFFLKKHGLFANGAVSSTSAVRSETYLTSTGIRHIQPYDSNSVKLSGGEIFIPYDQILSQQVLVQDCFGYEIVTNILHTKEPITSADYVTKGCPSTSSYIAFNSKSITLFGLVEPYVFQKSILDKKRLLSDHHGV